MEQYLFKSIIKFIKMLKKKSIFVDVYQKNFIHI